MVFFYSFQRMIEFQLNKTFEILILLPLLKIKGGKKEQVPAKWWNVCSNSSKVGLYQRNCIEQEYNIQLTQKKNQTMNYLTMVPNFYSFAPLQTPSYHHLAPQKEIQPFPNFLLLNAISQALNISLRNYQQQLTKSSMLAQKSQTNTLSVNEKPHYSQKVMEIIIPQKEEGEKLKGKINEQTTKKSSRSSVLTEKVNNITVQLPTDDQNILESKDTSNRKDGDSKKKLKKKRPQNKTTTFQVIVPEIDQVITAYLPQRAVNFESLAKKREQLMNRRVGDWNDFTKCKKQRREIRMLGN